MASWSDEVTVFDLVNFQNGLRRLLRRMMGDAKVGTVVVVEDAEGVG